MFSPPSFFRISIPHNRRVIRPIFHTVFETLCLSTPIANMPLPRRCGYSIVFRSVYALFRICNCRLIPSIHMLRADITTEVAPIVGSESQSEELILYLLKEFEETPAEIWESNIFGKSLHELVTEGLHNKLWRMPSAARIKIQETLEKIINEGCSGLICIIL